MRRIILLVLTALSFGLLAQGPAPRAELNLDDVVDQYGLTGEGVVVVMIDRGIDYTHPDFIDEDGNTRIAYIFDMIDDSGVDDPDNFYGVGTIFDQGEINDALQSGGTPLTTDRFGHGTATTGILCGDGSGTADGQFQGVAPGVTIISIKITNDPFPAFDDQAGQSGFFDPSFIPIALEFANDKIAELGLPSVTLLNIGSIGGPTDGTSLVCRSIDDYVADGNTFVCGVGDDGGSNNYARGVVGQGQTVELEIAKGELGTLRLDLWYNETAEFTVSIERPGGQIEGPFVAPEGPDGVADQSLNGIFIGHRGANREFFDATSNRRELLIDFSGENGTYKVILEGAVVAGDGEFQASLNPSRLGNGNRFLTNIVNGHSINDYSSAVTCISPGDYVVTNSWVSLMGVNVGITGQGAPGELWLGSSQGPTQDGRRGIDFVAPGEVCFGAYSPDTWYSSFATSLVQGGEGNYGIQNAVSAAAPLTAGVIALMLEVNPNLTPTEIKDILQNSCRMDGFTGTVPNNGWGFGKLDALTAIENTLLTDIDEPIAESYDYAIHPNPVASKVHIAQVGAAPAIERIEIFNAWGQRLWAQNMRQDQITSFDLSFLPQGVYNLVIHNEEGSIEKLLSKN